MYLFFFFDCTAAIDANLIYFKKILSKKNKNTILSYKLRVKLKITQDLGKTTQNEIKKTHEQN
jgi:hypothetical protein